MPTIKRFVLVPRKQPIIKWEDLEWFPSIEAARQRADELTTTGKANSGVYILEGVEVRYYEIKTECKSFTFSEALGDSNVTES